jgi:hypothetical protein
LELAAHGGQGQFFFIPQALDLQDELNIRGSVEAVPGAPPAGAQDLAPVFPIPQDMSPHPGDAAHLTDGIEIFLRNFFF